VKQKRILFYSHDALGLGHIRRTIAVAERIATTADTTALILTGSSVAQSFRLPPNVDFIKLPSLRKAANSVYEARNLRIGGEEIVSLRTRIIQETFNNFSPDILMVDKHPAGVMSELLPTLVANEQRRDRARVVLGLRDILDTPARVIRSWRSKGVYDVLAAHYDRILVWGMKEICDPSIAYRFPEEVARKVEFCGYIRREPDSSGEIHHTPADGRPLVLATAGGGEDGYPLFENFLGSLDHSREKFASVLLTGPDMPQGDRARLQASALPGRKNVFLIDFTNRMLEFVDSASVVVSMAGYNSVCEIISRRKKAILIPRVYPRQEQLIRARHMESLGLAVMIHPDELSPERLADAIDRLLTSPEISNSNVLDFNGLDRAASILRDDLGQTDQGEQYEGMEAAG